MSAIGYDPTLWQSEAELWQSGNSPRTLGQVYWDHKTGSAWMFVKLGTGGVTGDGYVVTIDGDFEAVMLTTSNDAEGDQIGVAGGAGAADDYGWVQIFGPAGVRSEQDAAANSKLGATSDAGQVDDAAATGLYIAGMYFRTATGGSDAVNTTGFLYWPRIEVRMEPEA